MKHDNMNSNNIRLKGSLVKNNSRSRENHLNSIMLILEELAKKDKGPLSKDLSTRILELIVTGARWFTIEEIKNIFER